MKRVHYLLGLLYVLCYGCVPYTEEEFTEINIDLSDPGFQQLYDFKNQQLSDSLVKYFNHPNPNFRYSAALAFGSVRDTSVLEPLSFLLQDPIDEVRAAAAFAIGQLGTGRGSQVLIENFARNDTIGVFSKTNRAILEAVGKCGDDSALKALSTIKTYRLDDTLLLEGQCWGLYRYALRNQTTKEGTQKMVNMAIDEKYPSKVRLIASSYLAVARNIALDSFSSSLSRTFFRESDPNIRMALAIALGKTQSPTALSTLLNQIKLDQDYRVKCNILRALGNFDYDASRDAVVTALKDESLPVAQRAAQFFVDFGLGKDATYYWQLAKDTLPWSVQLSLYKAAQRHLPNFYANYRGSINGELIRRFRKTQNNYEKATILDVLAEFGWNYRAIYDESQKINVPIVKTAGIDALRKISEMDDFRSFFGLGTRRAERELAFIFKEAIRSVDPGQVTTAALAFQNTSRNFKPYLDSLKFIDTVLLKLELPKSLEPYKELATAKAVLSDQEVPEVPQSINPINWNTLSSLAIEPQALIRTNKGVIKLTLFPKLAPATVDNFISLARSGFYKNSNFHRVVPNFVVQAGGNRGDGYGSADHNIQSEFLPIHYDQAGMVGMASIGPHSESSQFFITHAPTLNLDGQYSIFARVTDGLNIVNDITVGDVIEEIRIIQ